MKINSAKDESPPDYSDGGDSTDSDVINLPPPRKKNQTIRLLFNQQPQHRLNLVANEEIHCSDLLFSHFSSSLSWEWKCESRSICHYDLECEYSRCDHNHLKHSTGFTGFNLVGVVFFVENHRGRRFATGYLNRCRGKEIKM